MNFLAICQYGHSRSVCCCRVLHQYGHKAVAAGVGTAGSAISLLSEWADVILVMEPQYISHVPVNDRDKVVVIDVGRDRWSNPYNQELHAIIEIMLADKGLIQRKGTIEA